MGSARVVEQFAPSVDCKDHLMVAVDAKFGVVSRELVSSRRVPGFSRLDLGDSEVRLALQTAFDALPLIDRNVEPTTHCHLINVAVQAALAEALLGGRQRWQRLNLWARPRLS